jgi:pyruvate,water dikinase
MTATPTPIGRRTAIRPFAELNREDVAFAGGKGANLGELVAAGVPVPSGFVVGAPAYAAFCEETGVRDRIATLLDPVDVDDTAALGTAAAAARELVERAAMPSWLRDAIAAAYAELGGDEPSAPVAVRSSAIGEDTGSASFAGMNETFLNVRGADDVVAAVQRCWASLFGGRTVFYRAKRGFSAAGIDIAVVVQAQVASTRAGVMFTVDPATGSRDRIVIEGAFGLGESVVGGTVSPDRYVVDKSSGAVLVREIRRKEVAVESLPGGGTHTRPLGPGERDSPVLTDAEVARLAALALHIEEHYAAPQDTEWAFDRHDEVWMLQSRPVTTLGEPAGAELVRGLGAAPGVGTGAVRLVSSLDDAAALGAGDVLVTHMTSAPTRR